MHVTDGKGSVLQIPGLHPYGTPGILPPSKLDLHCQCAALSKDGFNWRKGRVTFEGGKAGEFDAGGAAACQVVSWRGVLL